MRDKRMEEQEGLKRKLRRLEANLRRMQVARVQAVARKRAEDDRKKEGKNPLPPPAPSACAENV